MSFDENSNKTKKVPLLSLLFMNVKKTRCPKQCTPGFYQEKSLCFDQQQQINAVNLDIALHVDRRNHILGRVNVQQSS